MCQVTSEIAWRPLASSKEAPKVAFGVDTGVVMGSHTDDCVREDWTFLSQWQRLVRNQRRHLSVEDEIWKFLGNWLGGAENGPKTGPATPCMVCQSGVKGRGAVLWNP